MLVNQWNVEQWQDSMDQQWFPYYYEINTILHFITKSVNYFWETRERPQYFPTSNKELYFETKTFIS